MIDNFMYMLQTTTVDQLKTEIDKNKFVDKNLKDFNKGKDAVDKLFELNKNNVDDSVKYSLIFYYMYKIKGGK